MSRPPVDHATLETRSCEQCGKEFKHPRFVLCSKCRVARRNRTRKPAVKPALCRICGAPRERRSGYSTCEKCVGITDRFKQAAPVRVPLTQYRPNTSAPRCVMTHGIDDETALALDDAGISFDLKRVRNPSLALKLADKRQ